MTEFYDSLVENISVRHTRSRAEWLSGRALQDDDRRCLGLGAFDARLVIRLWVLSVGTGISMTSTLLEST